MKKATLLLLFVFQTIWADATFSIPVWSIDGGAGKSQSSYFTLYATIGQSDSGVMQGYNYKLSGGFWFQREEQDICLVPILMYLLN